MGFRQYKTEWTKALEAILKLVCLCLLYRWRESETLLLPTPPMRRNRQGRISSFWWPWPCGEGLDKTKIQAHTKKWRAPTIFFLKMDSLICLAVSSHLWLIRLILFETTSSNVLLEEQKLEIYIHRFIYDTYHPWSCLMIMNQTWTSARCHKADRSHIFPSRRSAQYSQILAWWDDIIVPFPSSLYVHYIEIRGAVCGEPLNSSPHWF